MKPPIEVGQRVRVRATDWLVAGQEAVVLAFESRDPSGVCRRCPYEIRLDRPYSGQARVVWRAREDLEACE